MATLLEFPIDTLKEITKIIGKPGCVINLNLVSHFKGKNTIYPEDLYELGDEKIEFDDIIKMFDHIELTLDGIKDWPEKKDEKYGTYTYVYEGIKSTDNNDVSLEIYWGT